MNTGLKKSQKTAIIEFDQQGPRITVSTRSMDLKNRLGACARRWPEHCQEADEEVCEGTQQRREVEVI